ncbi:MAG: hypothetical protein ACPGO3_07225 [Magnetospiraceae bacterium]
MIEQAKTHGAAHAAAAASVTKPGQGHHKSPNAVESSTASETTEAVDLDLSAAAQSVLEESGRPGKSGQSPAHLARQAIAQYGELAAQPFGQIVSLIARNRGADWETLFSGYLTPAPAEEEITAENQVVFDAETDGGADESIAADGDEAAIAESESEADDSTVETSAAEELVDALAEAFDTEEPAEDTLIDVLLEEEEQAFA